MRRWHSSSAVLAATLTMALGLAEARDAGGDAWYRQAGGLLPLQDRVGDPAIAAAVDAALEQALAGLAPLADPVRLRDAQRRLRLRDPVRAAPEDLARLGRQAGAAWLFCATLHQATASRQSRAAEAFESERGPASPVPQVTLSAWAVRLDPDGAELAWAGFEARSGLDSRRLLGLGVVDDPEHLARRTAERLSAAFAREVSGQPAERGRAERGQAAGGFLRRPLTVSDLGTVALVPFGSVTERDATRWGETVTALAFAELHRRGAKLALPGEVHQVLRRRGALLRGEVDPEGRGALRDELGADTLLTGTVEAWEVAARSGEPEPRVAFSARLLDAGNGRILWWNGRDASGWDSSRLLGTGRTHAAGALAEEMMGSLVAGFLAPRGRRTGS